MTSTLLSGLLGLTGWNLSLLVLLTKATIILLAAVGITLSMHRTSAGARHLVWLVTLAMLLLVPALTAWGPWQIAVLPGAEPVTSQLLSQAELSQLTARAQPANAVTSGASTNSAAVAGASQERDVTAPTLLGKLRRSVHAMSAISILLAIWAAVVLGIVATLTWAGLNVRRIVRQARPLDTSDWTTPLLEISDRLGLDEPPRLVQSDEAQMPFACGVLAPTIVLPADAEHWTAGRRRAVLIHELAHVRRHDLFGHTLGRLACAFYWFHPLVWTAAKRLRSESERACDDLALACGTRATDYAEHLLDIVVSVRRDSTPYVALAMARRKEFEGRMLAILDPGLRRSSPTRRQSAGLIAALMTLSLSVAAVKPVACEPSVGVTSRGVESKSMDVGQTPAGNTTTRVANENAESNALSSHDGASRRVSDMTMTVTSTGPNGATQSTTLAAPPERLSDVVQGAPAPHPVASPQPAPSPATPAVPAPGVLPHVANNTLMQQLVDVSTEFGVNVATQTLRALGKTVDTRVSVGTQSNKTANKAADDRPILLARVLKSDTSASLRRVAAWGLHEYAESRVASDALAGAVKHDTDARVREMSAWSLGEGSDHVSGAIEALTTALRSDSDEHVRATAAWALGNIGDAGAVDALAFALGDASESVRMRAAWAIGNAEPKRAPRALVALLADKDARVRQLAAWALFRIEDISTAPALQTAFKSEQNKEVQFALIRALAVMGEQSVDALRGLLESPDARIKSMAVHALAGGQAAGPWPWPWPEPRPYP